VARKTLNSFFLYSPDVYAGTSLGSILSASTSSGFSSTIPAKGRAYLANLAYSA